MDIDFKGRPLAYRVSNLFIENSNLRSLVKKFGTPTYFYSKIGFTSRFKEFQSGLSALNHLICFAVKSNSNLNILNSLQKEGAGADIVSGGELKRCLISGISSNKIVFSGVGKTTEEIRYAIQKKILAFQVESYAELLEISRIAKLYNARPSISIRFNPNIDAKTHPYISTGLKENKFGISEEDIEELVKFSCRKSSNVKLEGLSIHIGSQLLDLEPLKLAFRLLAGLCVNLERNYPVRFHRLNFGGGLGISYKLNSSKCISVPHYTKLISDTLRVHHLNDRQILVEPGRSILGPYGILVSKILYKKKHAKKQFIILDAAMNDLMRPALYGSFHEIVPLSFRRAVSSKADFVGPICESTDALARNRVVLYKMTAGDYVAVLDAGAYGSSMSNQYNTRARPAEVLIEGKVSKLIRKRESVKDIFKNEIF